MAIGTSSSDRSTDGCARAALHDSGGFPLDGSAIFSLTIRINCDKKHHPAQSGLSDARAAPSRADLHAGSSVSVGGCFCRCYLAVISLFLAGSRERKSKPLQ